LPKKGRPGVMLYFDVRPCLKRLTLEEKGMLFDAILEYGQDNLPPDFEGPLGVAWDFIQPRIDADGVAYREKCDMRQKAAESRWAKERNFDSQSECECMHLHPKDANNKYKTNTITNAFTTAEAERMRLEAMRERESTFETRRQDAINMLSTLPLFD